MNKIIKTTAAAETNNCSCKGHQRSGALHLTQKVDYGLIILAFLAKNQANPQLSIRKIADQSQVSFLFLQKIAGLLQKAGLIIAGRGKFGGYKLARTPDKLNMREIIEALEGPIAVVPCMKDSVEQNCKHINYCTIRPGMAKLNAEIQNSIANKTLDYFIA